MKAQKIKAPKREAGGRGHVADRYAASHARYVETSVFIPQSESNDNAGFFRVSRNMDINLMDSWIVKDEGFDGKHLWSAHLCRSLWAAMPEPTARIVDREGARHRRASARLAEIKRAVGPNWAIFENAMRWNEPMGYIGSRIARQRPEHIAATKAVVRTVLEMIR